MLLAGSEQTPALGAAIAAAVAAGAAAGGYDDFASAQRAMTSLAERRFQPSAAARRVYDALYDLYRELHDTFGGVEAARADLSTLMKRLLAIRERAGKEQP
jgi:L-ribulokinase